MASFTLITTGKILWGTVHTHDISVTFSAGTKGGTIVRDNILTDAASVLCNTRDGQGRTGNQNFCDPKRSNYIQTYWSTSNKYARNQASESPCSASHLMSGLRHLNAWVSFFSRVYPFSGRAENTCVPWDGQFKWKSEHFTQVSSKKASCSRHPHLLSGNLLQKNWCDFLKGALTVTVPWILTTSFFLSSCLGQKHAGA